MQHTRKIAGSMLASGAALCFTADVHAEVVFDFANGGLLPPGNAPAVTQNDLFDSGAGDALPSANLVVADGSSSATLTFGALNGERLDLGNATLGEFTAAIGGGSTTLQPGEGITLVSDTPFELVELRLGGISVDEETTISTAAQGVLAVLDSNTDFTPTTPISIAAGDVLTIEYTGLGAGGNSGGDNTIVFNGLTINIVPEPGSLSLAACGIALLLKRRHHNVDR